jgi:hypothetical protein
MATSPILASLYLWGLWVIECAEARKQLVRHTYSSEGSDFRLEEINKKVQRLFAKET